MPTNAGRVDRRAGLDSEPVGKTVQRFFAAIASFLGRLYKPGTTAVGESATPGEPAASPLQEADRVATASGLEAANPSGAASGLTGPAVPKSPGPSSPVASPSGSASPTATEGRSRRDSRATAAADRVCPWCSAAVQASDTACPDCGAILDAPAADAVAIPGLTEVPSDLRRYAENAHSGKKRPGLLAMIFSDHEIPTAVDAPPPSDANALRPPSAAVRAEMARLDLDIAAGATPQPLAGAGPAAPQDPEPEPAGGEPRT